MYVTDRIQNPTPLFSQTYMTYFVITYMSFSQLQFVESIKIKCVCVTYFLSIVSISYITYMVSWWLFFSRKNIYFPETLKMKKNNVDDILTNCVVL